jgi:hypothetical protein
MTHRIAALAIVVAALASPSSAQARGAEVGPGELVRFCSTGFAPALTFERDGDAELTRYAVDGGRLSVRYRAGAQTARLAQREFLSTPLRLRNTGTETLSVRWRCD